MAKSFCSGFRHWNLLKKKCSEFELERQRWNEAVEKAGEIPPEDLPKYNGGMTHIEWCNGNEELGIKPLRSRLPIPDEGMKWTVNIHESKSGEILPELIQIKA